MPQDKANYDSAQWDLGNLTTGAGKLRPLTGKSGYLIPTMISLEDDNLYWINNSVNDTDTIYYQMVMADNTLLHRFIGLAEAPATAILRFAQRWGVLELCGHDLPSTHSVIRKRSEIDTHDWKKNAPFRLCKIRAKYGEEGGYDQYWEPIEPWRHFARQARAMLTIAAALSQGELPRREEWQTVFERSRYPNIMTSWENRNILIERRILAAVVSEWLALGQAIPNVHWDPLTNSMTLQLGRDLFSLLAVQLMATIGRTSTLVLCSSCGLPYLPKRLPTAGRRHYCPTCGRAAAMRDASRARTDRRRNQKNSNPNDGNTDAR